METTLDACPSPRAESGPGTAGRAAADHLRSNARGLALTQPDLASFLPELCSDPLAWVYARDGSLSSRATDGRWWAGCSLPARAAEQQLRTLDVTGPVACFLDPPHPAHLRAALDKTGPSQAIVAIVPDERALAVLLGCADLSADLAAHRLWFAVGPDWPAQVRQLFRDRPGLAAPTQFVRLALADPAALDPMIADARAALADVGVERARAARELAAGWRPNARHGPPRLCVVTARTYRLWDDAGLALAELAADAPPGIDLLPMCGDDPASASTLELLRNAVTCDALLTADFGRSELPDLLPADLPWVTWATSPRFPAAAAAGPNDRLVVADPAWAARAVAAGWRRETVAVGGWPAVLPPSLTPSNGNLANERLHRDTGFQPVPTAPEVTKSPTPRSADPFARFGNPCHGQAARPPTRSEVIPAHVALIADVRPLDPPGRLEEFSSHRLLWNAVRDELSADPYTAGADADGYLRARLRRFDVDESSLDRPRFVRELVEPAFAQGVIRRLLADGVPVRAYGDGWGDLPEFRGVAGGPIRSRAELAAAAAGAAALLDARPAGYATGLYALGRPVVRCGGRTHLAVRQDVASALAGRLSPAPAVPPINLAELLRWATGRA